MRTLVTGGTGFIGRHLLPHLRRPVVLSRHRSGGRDALNPYDLTAYDWDPVTGAPPAQAFDNVNVVVHLAGESVASGRWTKKKRGRIYESRVTGTSHLVQTLVRLPRPPKLLISASAVGFYGSRGDQSLIESAEPGRDFLADLCVAWESAASAASEAGIRVVTPRVGLVLGRGGGALSKMIRPFNWCVGGRLGTGQQWMPWIHIEDLVQIIKFLCEHPTLSGPINATSPQPVTNADFTKALGKALHRPTCFPVPAPLLRLALGKFADVVLASQRALPDTISRAGFEFQYPQIDAALDEIFGR